MDTISLNTAAKLFESAQTVRGLAADFYSRLDFKWERFNPVMFENTRQIYENACTLFNVVAREFASLGDLSGTEHATSEVYAKELAHDCANMAGILHLQADLRARHGQQAHGELHS